MTSSVRGLSSLRGCRSLHLRLASRHELQPSQPGRRAFHWQPTVSAAIHNTQGLIVDLHTVTQLPWFLTIPLVAITVGALFRLPCSIYSQRILQRRTHAGPLLQAWNVRIQSDVSQEGILPSQQPSEVKRRQAKVIRRINKKLGLQQWKLYSSLLSFPFWLLAIDGVRRLCGGPRGLIGSFITGSESDREDVLMASLPAVTGSAGDVSAVDPMVVSSAIESAHRAVVDPSLTYEGCLWFTDLTVSDPYHILPFALSVALVVNLMPKSGNHFWDRVRIAFGRRPKSAQAQTLAEDDKVAIVERMRSVFYLSMIGLACAVGPLTLDMPAALHLYWLSSSATNMLFAKTLEHLVPVKGKLRRMCTGLELPVIRPQQGQKDRQA
ncbi:hypothetical protein F5Y19DRAFT_213941 [Xylariaceae sp. FL1651]|nr:hypothetical protein F5Y19DRAFT_213941 [Xylariaceae sp. FL1651]